MRELLSDILQETVRSHGMRPALVESGRSLTYLDLDTRSDEIAAAIRRSGIRPTSHIAILRNKSIETIVCIYAILKSGCSYIPLDPRSGINKLGTILLDAQPELVFTEPRFSQLLTAALSQQSVSRIAGADGDLLTIVRYESDPSPSTIQDHGSSPSAYILYTSGTTGTPKGVEHTHTSAIAFASWAAMEFEITCNDRLSCHAPLHFDLTTFDLFAALIAGAAVVLIPEHLTIFPQSVSALMETEQITIWYSVPFALAQMTEKGQLAKRSLPLLREIIFAGERFPPAALQQLAKAVPNARLTNLFGPTETNVCSYHHLTAADLSRDEFCPIGVPCPYAQLAVVDDHDSEVLPGAIGNLLVAGDSVMAGYLNRPALNKQVFLRRDSCQRFFRTGDMVSAPADRPIIFHGRRDRQVKVRGIRIELDEIENILLRETGVSAAVAWVCRNGDGLDRILAAVETGSGARAPTEEMLTHQLSSAISSTAVPHRILLCDHLPRTTNGKIDHGELRRMLPSDF